MQVSSVASATTPSQTAQKASSAAAETPTLNYNSFLQLLMAQMKNQDPTSPTDSTQWVSQLATFSNVAQAVQANAKLDEILTTSNLSQAEGLIGHTITSADGKISGIVKSVTISSSGVTALLRDGGIVPISSGLTVS